MSEVTNPLARLSVATHALAEAKDLSEITQIRDIAEAARHYAKAAQLGIEAQNHAAEIKLRAERKAGEFLGQIEGAQGARNDLATSPHHGEKLTKGALVSECGISKGQADRWQTIATLPEDIFEQHIEETRGNQEELTTASVLRKAQEVKRETVRQAREDAPPLPTSTKYRIFYADPPWSYGNSGVINGSDGYGRAVRHYPTMSIAELCAMGADIRDASEENAVLFLWVTSPLLEECFDVIRAWGFKYKTSFVWDKVGHNFGHYNSVRHELLLICTKGSCTPDSKTLHDSVVEIQKSSKHSEKPEEFRQLIDSLYTWGNRIELFARKEAQGWDTWGNE